MWRTFHSPRWKYVLEIYWINERGSSMWAGTNTFHLDVWVTDLFLQIKKFRSTSSENMKADLIFRCFVCVLTCYKFVFKIWFLTFLPCQIIIIIIIIMYIIN